MAPRTLASTWRKFEKIARAIGKADPPSEALLTDLDDLTTKANRSRIVNALETLFVQGFLGTEEVRVRFAEGRDALDMGNATRYDGDGKVILLNPVGIVRFIDECERCVEETETREVQDSFERHRLYAYQAELSKLPSQMMLFLALLRQVAEVLDVTTADRRGGKAGAQEMEEDRPYLLLLWAFKQLEGVLREMKGVSLRSEYSILWYESDWILGRK